MAKLSFSGEGFNSGNGPADYESVDVVSAFVSVHCLQIDCMA